MADALSPKPVADKIGVKSGQLWALLGASMEELTCDLQDRGVRTTVRLPASADGIICRVDAKRDLDRLPRFRTTIAPDGTVWVIWRKGRPELREDDVRAAALAQGLVDVKVIRVSDELSGLKLVIPVKDR